MNKIEKKQAKKHDENQFFEAKISKNDLQAILGTYLSFGTTYQKSKNNALYLICENRFFEVKKKCKKSAKYAV